MCAVVVDEIHTRIVRKRDGLNIGEFYRGSPVRQHREIHVKSSCYVSYDGCLRDELCGSWDDEVLLCMRERATSCDWRIFVNSNRE